jgi:hypothetical protein
MPSTTTPKQSPIIDQAAALAAIRELTDHIAFTARHTDILLQSIVDKLDASTGLNQEALKLVAAIECFVLCAQTANTAISRLSDQSIDLQAQLAAQGAA